MKNEDIMKLELLDAALQNGAEEWTLREDGVLVAYLPENDDGIERINFWTDCDEYGIWWVYFGCYTDDHHTNYGVGRLCQSRVS